MSGHVLCELCTQKLNAVKRMDTETCFQVGHGNVFPCWDIYSESYALKKSVQSEGWTWKRVSVSDMEMCSLLGQVNCDLCIPKICAVKRMDTETCFRVGPRYVFPCQDK